MQHLFSIYLKKKKKNLKALNEKKLKTNKQKEPIVLACFHHIDFHFYFVSLILIAMIKPEKRAQFGPLLAHTIIFEYYSAN